MIDVLLYFVGGDRRIIQKLACLDLYTYIILYGKEGNKNET